MKKFSGYLEVDGTYVSVKGYDKKIPLIWGIDYLTHDIPYFILAPSENYPACLTFFKQLKMIGYKLIYLVCDDSDGIKMAGRDIYPNVIIQTCLKHYRDSIQRDLGIKVSDRYSDFYYKAERMFSDRLCNVEVAWEVTKLYEEYGKDPKCSYWLEDIMLRRSELTNYHMLENTPNTTNLIEAYNSHLKARLKSIKGFESYHSAKLWLNAYIVRRRISSFTDCGRKFKHLNGFCSLQKTLKKGLNLPNIF